MQKNKIEFNEGRRIFSVTINDSVFEVPSILDNIKVWDPEEFDIYSFKHKYLSENSIFRIYFEESSIAGWIIPIQSLESEEHDYAKDEHFSSAAWIALYKLLQQQEILSESQSGLSKYHPETAILLLSKSEIGKIANFNIEHYLPSLFRLGYDNQKAPDDCLAEIVKNIRLESISPALRTETFFIDLFKSAINSEKNDIVTFLLLYQVIEILIFDIFQDGIKHCLDKFINLNEDQYDEYWELSYEMYDAKKEKTRIKKLLSPEYTNIPNQPTLTAHCNELLVGIGKKEESNLSQALYATRNNIVHAYRLFKEPQKDKLKILLPEFVNLIIDILITYKR